MAQHDFVPAWLNFSTPQPAKVKCKLYFYAYSLLGVFDLNIHGSAGVSKLMNGDVNIEKKMLQIKTEINL